MDIVEARNADALAESLVCTATVNIHNIHDSPVMRYNHPKQVTVVISVTMTSCEYA